MELHIPEFVVKIAVLLAAMIFALWWQIALALTPAQTQQLALARKNSVMKMIPAAWQPTR